MSKELHIALQNAIGDLGTDVLKSPFLVNILQDYGALGQHEKGSEQIKERLRELARKGYIESIISWRNLPKEQIQKKSQRVLDKCDDTSYAQYTINAVLKAMEMPTLQIQAPPPKLPQTKQVKSTNASTDDDTSKIVLNVLLVIGGIALAVLLVWLISKIFLVFIFLVVILSLAKK